MLPLTWGMLLQAKQGLWNGVCTGNLWVSVGFLQHLNEKMESKGDVCGGVFAFCVFQVHHCR